MSLKSFAAKIFANYIKRQTQSWASKPVETQQKVFQQLIQQAKNTSFGKDHSFDKIQSTQDFAQQVPIRDYEE